MSHGTVISAVFGVLVLVVNPATLHAQPVFKSAVEVIPIDVTVVDAKGAPVRGLAVDDFTVRIDGKPRRVFSARFYGSIETVARPTAAATAAAPPSFVDNTRSPAGRVVVFVVDLESIKAGHEKLVLDTAARLADGLGPNDAVGLLPIPGKSIDLTRDHALVRKALETLRGAEQPFWWQGRYITVAEARAFDLGDNRTIAEVIERECTRMEPECGREVRRQAREILFAARARITNVLGTLTSVTRALKRIEAPKTLVFISGGLPFELESVSYFNDLHRAVAESGTRLYVIQANQPETDISQKGRAGAGQFQPTDMYHGLSMAAGYGGAPLMAAVGAAVGVFDRLRVELANSYQLGVESLPRDGDGKSHEIHVEVRRPGVEVRSRREFIAAADSQTVMQRLAALMTQPVDTPDLPIAIAAYTVRGDAPDTLKVVLFAEIARGTTVSSPVQFAATFLDHKRRAVFETNGYADTQADGTAAHALLAAQLAPGRYRVRLAAVDKSARGGTVELPVIVGLRTAADVTFSDLLLGITTDKFRPVIAFAPGSRVSALVELYASDPQVFATVHVRLELRAAGNEEEILRRKDAELLKTDLDRRWLAQGDLTLPPLPRGTYTVSAIIVVGDRPVGKVSRQIELAP